MATQAEKKLAKQKKGKAQKKSSIHKNFGEIEVTMTDGTKFKTFSTIANNIKELKLDVCPKSHNAWKLEGEKSNTDNTRFAKVKDFKDKYEGLDI